MAKYTVRQFIVQYGIHISILLFFVGFAIRQTIIYFVAADNCIPQEQWLTMSQDHGHCYVMYQRKGVPEVWQPAKDGGNNWSHKGNAICGTDVTSVIPASHLANPNKFLNIGARYVGTIGACARPMTILATVAPTSTAKPVPVIIPASQLTANAAIAVVLGVLGLAFYLKIKGR